MKILGIGDHIDGGTSLVEDGGVAAITTSN